MALRPLIIIETWLIFSNSSCLINITIALSSMSCGKKKHFFLSFSVRDTSLQNPVSINILNILQVETICIRFLSFLTDGYSLGQNERNLTFNLMLRLNKMKLGPKKQAALKVQSGALTFSASLFCPKCRTGKKGKVAFSIMYKISTRVENNCCV